MAEEPLRTTTYTLTRADALAFEQASSRLGPLGTIALILWLALCGSAAWLIPPDWAGFHLGWSFSIIVSIAIAVGYVVVLLGMSFRQYLRAAARIRRPQDVTLSEWPDRLAIIASGLMPELRFAEIRESILNRTHLFLIADGGVLILPRHAFAEEGVVEELAARIAGQSPAAPVDAGPQGA